MRQVVFVQVILGTPVWVGKRDWKWGAAHRAGKEQGRAMGHGELWEMEGILTTAPHPGPGLLGCLPTLSASHG